MRISKQPLLFVTILLVTLTGIAFGQESNVPDNKEDRPMKMLTKPRPTYTEEAKKDGVSGTVKLSVTFEADGKIGDVECINEDGEDTEKLKKYGLVTATIDAVRLITFDPEIRGGKAITVKKVLHYSFSVF